MLGYRHIYHAGSAADVFKHCVYSFCLNYMCKKEKGFLCVDTHAGAGVYSLDGAERNKEWERGIGALRQRAQDGKIPDMVRDYLALESDPRMYYGSPFIAGKILRSQDRLICYEKHPSDFSLLASYIEKRGKSRNVEARNADGFSGLKACLPPISRRACVFIDPSYELIGDYEETVSAVTDALRRFPSGIYIVWYPLLRLDKRGEALRDGLINCFKAFSDNFFYAELATEGKEESIGTERGGLYGSGLAVCNPPWTMIAALEEASAFLAETLGNGRGYKKIEFF